MVGTYPITPTLADPSGKLTNYAVSTAKGTLTVTAAGLAALFVGRYVVPRWVAVASGALMTLLAGVHSLKKLCRLVSLERLPGPARRILVLFQLAPPNDQD